MIMSCNCVQESPHQTYSFNISTYRFGGHISITSRIHLSKCVYQIYVARIELPKDNPFGEWIPPTYQQKVTTKLAVTASCGYPLLKDMQNTS